MLGRTEHSKILPSHQGDTHQYLDTQYSKTCPKRPLKEKTKNWFSRPIIA